MKPIRTLIVITLLLWPFAGWAQNNSPAPPKPNPGEISAGPLIAGQAQAETPPPPPEAWIQRRVITTGGPENATFMPLGSPGHGEGLGAWWKNSEVVSKLQLSDEQVKKISQTFLDHKLKLIDLQADLEKQELRLQPLMDVDQPDESTVSAQIDLIAAARGRVEKENAMMMLDIRRRLSIEQRKKLKSLEAAEEAKHNVIYFRGGPGINIQGPPPPLPGDLPVEIPVPPR
jgi:Spy/CpxP family protein refolding chaperone